MSYVLETVDLITLQPLFVKILILVPQMVLVKHSGLSIDSNNQKNFHVAWN